MRQTQENQSPFHEQRGTPPPGSEADISPPTIRNTILRISNWAWSFILPGTGCDLSPNCCTFSCRQLNHPPVTLKSSLRLKELAMVQNVSGSVLHILCRQHQTHLAGTVSRLLGGKPPRLLEEAIATHS
jgi:hypothetical protein